jgi:pimeloyl-ACP methyl ester carboxylesterase
MVRTGRIVLGALAGLILLSAAVTVIGDVLIDRAHPPVGRFIDTTSGRQHVLDVGPDDATAGNAPALVLMHGANANLGDMRLALVGRLRARHRVIAIDRPGHGWSERSGGAADASPRRQAAVVHEILDKLNVRRPILLGHSWSGALVAAYALAYPDDLGGLVLMAPATNPWTTGLPWYFDLEATPVIGPLFIHTLALPLAYLALDRLVDLVFDPQRPPPDYVERAGITLALRPSSITANSEDLAVLKPFVTEQAPHYPEIKTRTVVITGTNDRIVTPRVHARAIAAQIPGAQLVVLEGIGHMPHQVSTDRVVAAVEALAASVPRP